MYIIGKIWSFFVDTIQTVLIGASILLVTYIFLFRPFEVSGLSMYPTFKDKEYVLTNLITLQYENLKRGDVVVFKSPVETEKDYIKRVIGVPGDTVSIRSGNIYLNNGKSDESLYLKSDVRTYGGAFLKEGQQATVPSGSYFVVGDNRPHSSDSREFGFIKKESIIGKSFYVYWPPTNMRLIVNPFSSSK